jgi:hypothetical protein
LGAESAALSACIEVGRIHRLWVCSDPVSYQRDMRNDSGLIRCLFSGLPKSRLFYGHACFFAHVAKEFGGEPDQVMEALHIKNRLRPDPVIKRRRKVIRVAPRWLKLDDFSTEGDIFNIAESYRRLPEEPGAPCSPWTPLECYPSQHVH